MRKITTACRFLRRAVFAHFCGLVIVSCGFSKYFLTVLPKPAKTLLTPPREIVMIFL